MEKVTMKDVARRAGVSYATVSRALSGSPEISAQTRERVLRICEEMNFTPNVLARSMVMKRTDTLGVIMAAIDNPFMSELANYIELYARRRGYNLMLCNSSYDPVQERKSMELLVSRQADGVIVIPFGGESYENLSPLLDRVPTLFLSENMAGFPVDSVSVDNARGTYLGTDYLYELGHRRILYLGRRRKSVAHEQRARGYLNACATHGLVPEFLDSAYSRSSVETGYLLAREYFAKPLAHSAIYCATDSLAIGVMKAADEAGIRIPEDLSLIGFDNISFTSLPRLDLTTVDQPKERMAAAAVDRLLEKIADPDSPFVHHILEPTLVERSSCRRVEEE